MAFYLGNTKIIDTSGAAFPLPSGTDPLNQTIQYDTGAPLVNNGTVAFFAYPGATNSTVGTGFETRSIFTHGYQVGGYKNGVAWRTVNKTWHQTDITYSCGEQLETASAYNDCSWSDYNGYVFAAAYGSSSQTCSINLHTGIARNRRSGLSGGGLVGLFGTNDTTQPYGYVGDNPTADAVTYGSAAVNTASTDIYLASGVGGWSMSVSRDVCGNAVNQIGQESYVTGGGSSVTNRMHFPTEIMYTTTDSGLTGVASGAHGETKGYINGAGTKKYITYSTQTWTAMTLTGAGDDGHQKFMSTKKGWHYIGMGVNVGSRYIMKFSESTNASVSTTVDRGQTQGEDANQMGQDWGYSIGGHDGTQNAKTFKWAYATDTITIMGAATRPKGHYGFSSGACMSAAASITASQSM